MVIWLEKLVLKYPTLNIVKEKLSNEFPNEMEIFFKNKKDNIKELEIIDYLIHSAGYFLEELKATDDSKTIYSAYFKRKS